MISIISSFFTKIILDDTIPIEIADEIFAITIVKVLTKRDKKLLARIIYQICQKNLPIGSWASQLSKAKLEILRIQLNNFSENFDPMIQEIPILLRVT